MDRQDIILITLFVIVLCVAGFLLIFDPADVGNFKNNSTNGTKTLPNSGQGNRPVGKMNQTPVIKGS